jgi:hypothetical protein
LCQTVLATAARATARANQRAHLLYQRALGPRADQLLDSIGLDFDPDLVDDETEVRVQAPARPAQQAPARRAQAADEDEFPDSWMRRG